MNYHTGGKLMVLCGKHEYEICGVVGFYHRVLGENISFRQTPQAVNVPAICLRNKRLQVTHINIYLYRYIIWRGPRAVCQITEQSDHYRRLFRRASGLRDSVIRILRAQCIKSQNCNQANISTLSLSNTAIKSYNWYSLLKYSYLKYICYTDCAIRSIIKSHGPVKFMWFWSIYDKAMLQHRLW